MQQTLAVIKKADTLKLILIILLPVTILILILYLKSKKHRIIRASKLSNSSEFRDLLKMGFTVEIIESFKVFIGKYKDYNFLIYIDPMDHYFSNEFSIVFVTSYEKINDDNFKQLNDSYYNRLKSLLINSEYVFFDKVSAQFRYSISPYRISSGRLKNNLDKITDVLKSENLESTEFENLKKSMIKHY